MVSILIFGFLLGAVRFFRMRTATNLLSCVKIIGDPNNDHRNDDIFENSVAFASVIILFLLVWLLFDDQFTFGQGYITQQFGLIVPDDKGLDNIGFSPNNALGVVAGICMGEGVRNIAHLFEPAFEGAIASDMKHRSAWSALDTTTQAAAETCAMIYDLNDRTSRIVLAAFSSIFQLRDEQKSAVTVLFDAEMHSSKRLPVILKPLRTEISKGSAAAVLFFEQIVKTGVASGHVGPQYIDRLKMLARALGISSHHAQATLDANGFTAARQQQSQPQYQHRSSHTYQSHEYEQPSQSARPLNNTEKNLAVLGLHKGASKKEIKASYRRMAKKYHPDILKSKNLSEAQMVAATQTMLQINAAYEWLEN